MMLLALGVSFSAFTALSLAMEKHPLDLHGKQAALVSRRRQWSVLGWVLLGAAFGLSVVDHGWAMGPVLWLGTMTIAGLLLAFGLYPWKPRWLAPLALALPALGLVAALV